LGWVEVTRPVFLIKNKSMSFERKRLFADIETSPNIGMFWSAGWKLNIGYENIIKERAIICICYKWEHENEWHWLTWNRDQCDRKMLKQFVAIMDEADEIVGHNGDKFDWAWVRTRALYHDIPMKPKYQTIDTLKIARSKFRFNSNRLDYLAKFLGVGQKKETTYGLWKDILLNKCKKSMAYMVDYCGEDVLVLEKVFNKMKNHIEPKLNYAALYESNKTGCPECGSEDLAANGTRATLTGIIKRQFKCRGCGKYHYKTIRSGKN